MRTTLLLLAILAAPAFAGQTVWKWVDANGVTHYADRPVPGATKMELSTGTSSGASSQTYSPSPNSTLTEEPGPAYRTLEIWKPSQDETIANTGGAVTINVRLEPELRPGNSVFLYLDGRMLQGFSGDTISFELDEVPRGTHTVMAVVTNERGERIQQSAAVTFHVRQESIAQPPTGPGLRPPPPKPQPRAGNKMATSQPTYAALNPAAQNTVKIDPATNRPVVTKPTVKPSTPKAGK